MLADQVEAVIGVDTHRDTHALAIVAARTGAVIGQASIGADEGGYEAALALALAHAPGPRAWAIEGTGAYGAGLARHLASAGERVIEIDRPERRGERRRAKDDPSDAVRAARTALGRRRATHPRSDGAREALRVLMIARAGAVDARATARRQLKALVVTAPEPLRARLTGLRGEALLRAAASLGPPDGAEPGLAATCRVLGILARRADEGGAQARELEAQIAALVDQLAPGLCDEPGLGPISAAQIVLAWSHPGRIHSEAAFARLGGVAPIPASSGQVVRHRLDRGGDRQLNRALHTIVVTRRRCHGETRAYIARRTAEGKSAREAVRSLKRYLARHLYRRLEAMAAA